MLLDVGLHSGYNLHFDDELRVLPKQVYLMTKSMSPIVKEVDHHKQYDGPIPSIWYGKYSPSRIKIMVNCHG